MNKKTLVSIVILVVFFGFLFFVYPQKSFSYIKIGNRDHIPVVVADTSSSRARGLSKTTTIPQGGMLFVFPQAEKYGFWMKDMEYAIDILWIAENGEIVDITDDFDPLSYPDIVTPQYDVRYVLEVADTFVEDQNVQIGEYVLFDLKK